MKNTFILLLIFIALTGRAQVVADTTFEVTFAPKYSEGTGPCVSIDAGHNNLHTAETNFKPFAMLLEQDGYTVKNINTTYSRAKDLSGCQILVISNALHHSNLQNWQLPTPSAFTEKEVKALNKWVHEGGRLWLIADHMPFAGAANQLAQSFGFEYSNGFAQLAEKTRGDEQFSKANGRLTEHAVTDKIPFVISYTGSAFTYPEESDPLMVFTAEDISREPAVAWQFNDSTPLIRLENYAQGALLNYGVGKVAVFGEAAMFTAQIAQGKFKVGFNNPRATHNANFALNVLHWLDQGKAKPTKQSAQNEILSQLNAMEESFREEKYEELANFYSDSAVITGKGVEISGRASIQNYWKSVEGSGESWELENTELLKLAEDCYLQRGISRMGLKRNDELIQADSKFSLVWIREDGQWVILLDHFSPLR